MNDAHNAQKQLRKLLANNPSKTADGKLAVWSGGTGLRVTTLQNLRRDGYLDYGVVTWENGSQQRAYTMAQKGLDLAQGADVPAFDSGSKHSQKALDTFAEMGAAAEEWFHPAVKWVEEMRPGIVQVTCPDCGHFHDSMRGNRNTAFYTAEDAQKPASDTKVRAVIPPHGVEKERAFQDGEKYTVKDAYYDNYNGTEYRDEWAKENGLVKQPCRRCYSAGSGRGWRRVEAGPTGLIDVVKDVPTMVGYILWPKGVEFTSRFRFSSGHSRCHCQICGKGINKSGRVPLAYSKDGKALGMWVGEDCARKFTKVAKMAKPSKDENKKGLESIFDENFEVPTVE